MNPSKPNSKPYLSAELLTGGLLLFLLAGLAYLLQVRGWGFYKDDWHLIWTGSTQGLQGIFRLFLVDRPFMGVIYAITYRLLGESPLAWQIFAFVARVLGMLAFWWLARMLFPSRPRMTLLMAAVFILYPGFYQQPNANTFQNHFLGYGAAVLSIAFSIRALRARAGAPRVAWTVLAVGLALFTWMIYEYMIGLEAVRFLLLDLMLQRENPLPWKRRGARLLRLVLPFLLAAGAFLVWRLVIYKGARSVTDVGSLGSMYLSRPGEMLLRLALEGIRDSFETLVLAWFVPLHQYTTLLDYPALLVVFLVAALGGMAWWFFTRRLPTHDESSPSMEPPARIVWLGVACALITLIPILLANRDVHFSDQFDRYTLQATLGVAIAVGGLLEALRSKTAWQWTSAALIALALTLHIANGFYYQKFWAAQQQLWWQLSWRAPALKDSTTIIALLPGGYRLAEGYEIWGPANRIYHPGEAQIRISGETMNGETLARLLSGEAYGRTFRNLEYMVEFQNSLVANLPPGSCLHVEDGSRMEISGNDDALARLVAPFSRIDLIDVNAPPAVPPQRIFGREPAHGWCYYYQKISLERQREGWQTGATLADEALGQGLAPSDPSEWMPLYEVYYRAGNLDRANELGALLRAAPEFIGPYCAQFAAPELAQQDHDAFLVRNICPQIQGQE